MRRAREWSSSPPDSDEIVRAVTPRTRLVAVSHVLWTTGQILPVHELKERTGLPILVDGAQSVGAIPVDARGLDFFTISGQKWLCGPEGTGALVVADPDGLRVARPSYFSQAEHLPDGTFCHGRARADSSRTGFPPARWRASKRRSTFSPTGDSSGQLRWQSGAARSLSMRASRSLCRPSERRSSRGGRRTKSRNTAVTRLAEAGVVVRELPGRGLLRASVGWWTSDEDLDRLVSGARV